MANVIVILDIMGITVLLKNALKIVVKMESAWMVSVNVMWTIWVFIAIEKNVWIIAIIKDFVIMENVCVWKISKEKIVKVRDVIVLMENVICWKGIVNVKKIMKEFCAKKK